MTAQLSIVLQQTFEWFFAFMTREILYSALLFLPVFILSGLLRKKSQIWQLGLWSFVLIRLVIPPGFSLPGVHFFGLKDIPILNELKDHIHIPLVQINSAETSHGLSGYSGAQTGTSLNPYSAGSETDPGSNDSYFKTAIFFFWLLGFLLTLSMFSKRYLYFRKLIRNASSLRNARYDVLLDHWRRTFRIKRNIKIVSSRQFLSPFTIGVFKPVIYLPHSLLESADENLISSILSHEAAHIKHFDDLWIKFQNIIQSVYFFYPVVWYANSQISLARECLRDSLVISKGRISPFVLGKGILSFARGNLPVFDYSLNLPHFGNRKKKIARRLRNLKAKHHSVTQRILIHSMLIMAGTLIIPVFASLDGQPPTAGAIETTDADRFVPAPETEAESVPESEFMITERQVPSKSEKNDRNFASETIPEKGSETPSVSSESAEERKMGKEEYASIMETSLSVPMNSPVPEYTEILAGVRGDGMEIITFDTGEESPLRLPGQFSPPRLIKRIEPVFPQSARQDRVEGTVILEAVTDTTGKVMDVKIMRSIPKLDQAAVEAVSQWEYEPMMINGRPRSVIFTVKVHFKLLK